MSILLHKPYLVFFLKWPTKGEGGVKTVKNCPYGLWMTPAPYDYITSYFAIPVWEGLGTPTFKI